MKAATKGAIKISFIVLSITVSIIFLAIFLIPVLAPDIVQEKKYIGSDNIELGTKNETLGDFTVKFTHIESGISQQIFDISVQNLLNTNANANITSILEPLISGSIGGDVQLFEWKNISYTVPSYESILINETRWNETYSNETGELISNVSYEYSYLTQVQNGTDTLYKLDWKPSKQYLFNSNDKVETNYGVVNIDKFGSKQKDDTVNGTKLFRVIIPTKLVQTANGWGSSGLFMINVNGNTYFDTTNSSWWSSSYAYKKQINITAASTLPAGYTVNLTWDMTQANILNTGNDTRVVIDDGTNTLELDRNITSNGTANSLLEFKLNSPIAGGASNTSYYIYYGYSAAGNPPNNRTNVYYYFTGFEEYANNTQPAGWVKSDGNLYTTNELNSNPALYWSTGASQPMSALYLGRNLTTKNYTVSLNTYFKTNPTGHAGISYKANTTQTNLEYYTQTDGDDFYHYSFVGGVQNQENIVNSLKRNTGIWNTWQVNVYNESKTISGYFNGTLLSVYNGVGNLYGDRAYGLSGGYRVSPMYVDNLLVRLLVPSNPTITIGAEETINSPPKWSNNQSSIGTISYFNTTWNDDLDTNGYNFSFFELGFPNGTSSNYTAIRFPQNKSHYNLSIVSRGYHNFSFYANDSSNGWNKTSVWKFLTNANETTTNNATQTSWNETFTGNQNNTFWINMPKYAQVIDAKLNLSGYKNYIIDQSTAGVDGSAWCYINSNNISQTMWRSQSFIPDGNYIDKIDFRTFLSSGQGMTVNVSIRNSLAGSNLISRNFSANPDESSSVNLGLSVTPSSIYYIIFKSETTCSADKYCQICFSNQDGNDGYSKGYSNLSTNSGAIWGQTEYPNADFAFRIYNNSNSSNPYLDVSQNGNKDWQFGGEFNQTNNRTANFSSEVQSYLSTCTAKADGTCDVPFILHSDTAGKIQVSDISVLWYMGNRPPNWLANATSKASPQTYNPSNDYGFQINWTDIDNNFANATFQLGRPTGTLDNYTNSSTIKTQYVSGANYTGNAVWYINFTQDQLGGVGTYNYTWFGIDEEGGQNKTDIINYIINQNTTNPINLWFRNATNQYLNQNMTITYESISNTTAIMTYQQAGTMNLFYNDLLNNTLNNTNMTLGAGSYKITANTSGNTNYTSNMTTYYIIISQKNINIYLALNGTQANKNYNYPDVLNATVWKDATLNNEGTLTLLENGTSKSNPRIWQPAVKTYNYSAYLTATNYSANSIQDRMAIYSKLPISVRLFLDGNESSKNIAQGKNANFTTTSNISMNISLDTNISGWSIINVLTPLYNTTKMNTLNTYNITAYAGDSENYSGNLAQTYYATVIAPLTVSNPAPTDWFYDLQQKTDNFYTNFWNVTKNGAITDIANITFVSEAHSSGSLQTYYDNFLSNTVAFNATSCNSTIIDGSSCSIFARYKNLNSNGQTLNVTYNITYTDGQNIQNVLSTSVTHTNETTTQNNSYINITLIKVNSTSASINSLNLKGISSTQALWLNTTQNLDYEIGNPTSQTLTNVNVTLNVPYGYTVNKSQIISSLAAGVKRNITFQVNTTDVSTFRGWGLDTFWIIANSSQNVDGANYNMFRLLVQKNISINIDIPGLKELGNTTAGTPITITVNFTNTGSYSIFYPHIFLNLNGTFGFEAGHITSKTSTDPTNTVCRTDLNKTVNPKTSPINASRTLYSIYGWKGASAESIRTVELKPSVGILTPDWNESVSYDVNVNNIIIGSGSGSSIDSFIPTITASSLADALGSIVLNQNNNMTFRVTPNSAAPSGRYNISYPVCYEGGISSTNDIFSPPLAMKIFIQKDTGNAFRVPGYEDLVRTSTESIAAGQSSSTYSFSIIPPSVSETYTISAIVFDDTETGQWFEETKQLNALNTYPDKNIAVKDYDYNTSELVADAAANSPRFNITRRMAVENRNLNNYSMIEWRTVFPGDASNISGTLSGVVENLCGNCITYPSNISFTLPGVSIWSGAINYDSSYTTVGSNITGTVTITQYNNASTQTWYDVKVNATNHVPANYSAASGLIWFITSLRPERQTTNSISITSLAPNETNWTIARNATDYYIYNATIEVPNNNTKNREIRYVFDRSRLTDYSSDNLAYTVDGNAANLSYSISASQFTLTIPASFNNGQSLDYGNHTVIISYSLASTTVSVSGGGTVYAPSQCNIGYQLIGNKCISTDIGFRAEPDSITMNVSEWSLLFGITRQIALENTINDAVNISVRVEGDESREWILMGVGMQNLKTLSLTLKPKTAFESGIGFLTYSVSAPANTTGTYHSKIILQNTANKKEIVIPVEINILPSSPTEIWKYVLIFGSVIGVVVLLMFAVRQRRDYKRKYSFEK